MLIFIVIIDLDSTMFLLMMNNTRPRVETVEPPNLDKVPDIDFTIDLSQGNDTTNYDSNHTLLQISKLNNGYIKELLDVYYRSSIGEFNNLKFHTPMLTLLGMHTNESGLYSSESKIPKSYLPFNGGTSVTWNVPYKGLPSQAMTLMGLGRNERQVIGDLNRIDSTGGYNVFQYLEGSIPDSRSKVNGVTNSSRIKGEVEYLPDVLTWIDERLNEAIAEVKLSSIEELTFSQVTNMISTSHNRGVDGWLQNSFGIAFGTLSSDLSKNYINKSNIDKEKLITQTTYLGSTIDRFVANNKTGDISSFIDSDFGRRIAMAVGYKDGWYFSNYAIDRIDSKYLQVWNALFPKEQINNLDTYRNMIKQRNQNTLSEVILKETGVRVSTADTKKVYNTSVLYDDCSYFVRNSNKKYGYMVKVLNERSEVYKHTYSDGSTPFLVVSYDMVSAGHSVSSAYLSSFIYEYLIAMSSPSNVPWMNTYGLSSYVDSPERLAIINTAYSHLGIKYVFGGQGYDLTPPTDFDCSSFVYRVYKDAGFNVSRDSTGGMMFSNTWKWIPYSQVKPGDIAIRRRGQEGHVFIILGERGKNLITIEAIETGTLTKINESRFTKIIYKGDQKPQNTVDNNYYCFRHKDLD